MIVVVAAMKGGVGKTTTAVYLAALAASGRRSTTLVDADAQASAADWLERTEDERTESVELVEAPTERLLGKALAKLDAEDVAIVDTPPGHERLTAKALELADVVVIPTRVGGVETPRVEAVLDLVPRKTPAGLVICSARTFTRLVDMVAGWKEVGVQVWGTIPERVTIRRVRRTGCPTTASSPIAPSGAAPSAPTARAEAGSPRRVVIRCRPVRQQWSERVGRRFGVVRPLRGTPGDDVVGTPRIACAHGAPRALKRPRQEGSGAAAALVPARRRHLMKPRRERSSTIATALAGAFLAGEWDPPAMGRRAKRALGDRRKWLTDLAHVVGFPRAARRPAPRARRARRGVRDVLVHARGPEATASRPRLDGGADRDGRAPLARAHGERPERACHMARRHPGPPRLVRGSPVARTERDRRAAPPLLAPMAPQGRRLAAAARSPEDRDEEIFQRRILRAILDRIPAHEATHGFCHGRSVLTAAEPHRGQEVVIRIDLETFFTTVTAGRVYGLFRLAGYPEPVAHTLTGLCTTTTPTAVLHDAPAAPPDRVDKRRRMLQALREPHLPQGSPTSPTLANLIAYGLDRRLSGLAAKLDATYTRYADDLIVSGPDDLGRRSESVVALVRRDRRGQGLRVHEGKDAGPRPQRQLVTGLVVNERLNVRRAEYDRLRAILHDAALHGPEAANRGSPGLQGAPRGPGSPGSAG